uniref:WW domain-containing protein n=1 Tax=viral metagenome TaxID=1070528 RepID=A0A6C0H4R8_9ZZZZ
MKELDDKCWKQLISKSKKKYYFFNVEKGESQWNYPNSLYPLPKYWNIYKSKKTDLYYYVNTLTHEKTWNEPRGEIYLPPEEEIEGWQTKKSRCGNVYYINNSNNTTTWKKPMKKSLGVYDQEEERIRLLKQEEERIRLLKQEEERIRLIKQEEERIRLFKQEEERIRLLKQEEERIRLLKQEEERIRLLKQEEERIRLLKQEEERKRKQKEAIFYEEYYTRERDPKLMYSDHAPILYPINPHINIITWNVAQYGNIQNKKLNTYNHKFNMDRVETEDEYKRRLQNIVIAIDKLFSLGETNMKEAPFVFLQELPNAHGSFNHANKDKQLEFKKLFNRLLTKKDLSNISFNDRPLTEDNNSEFGLIVRSGNPKNIKYLGNFTPTFKELLDLLKFKCEVYSTLFNGRSIVYVNLHMKYEDDFKNNISLKLTRVTQGLFKVIEPKPLIIYFIGDFNNNIFEDNFVINKMNESFRGVHMPIKNIEKYTTPGNKAYSLMDNVGNENPENIDGIIKVEFN